MNDPIASTLTSAVAELVRRVYGDGATATRVSIFVDGIDRPLSVPLVTVPRATVPARVPAAEWLDETDSDIVQAALESGRTMSAEELASAAGYDMNSRFRERLGRLVRQGFLAKRHPGYAHPDTVTGAAGPPAEPNDRPVNRCVNDYCLNDIIKVLSTRSERMTGTEISAALQAAGNGYAESTVRHTLSYYTNCTHPRLTNAHSGETRGYGLPDWE